MKISEKRPKNPALHKGNAGQFFSFSLINNSMNNYILYKSGILRQSKAEGQIQDLSGPWYQNMAQVFHDSLNQF